MPDRSRAAASKLRVNSRFHPSLFLPRGKSRYTAARGSCSSSSFAKSLREYGPRSAPGDAGGHIEPEESPHRDRARHAFRILDIIDNQFRSLRKRQVIAAYEQGERDGTCWGIRTNILDYQVDKPLPCPFDKTMVLARIPSRLKALSDSDQMR
jgi:hypothetical protein